MIQFNKLLINLILNNFNHPVWGYFFDRFGYFFVCFFLLLMSFFHVSRGWPGVLLPKVLAERSCHPREDFPPKFANRSCRVIISGGEDFFSVWKPYIQKFSSSHCCGFFKIIPPGQRDAFFIYIYIIIQLFLLLSFILFKRTVT